MNALAIGSQEVRRAMLAAGLGVMIVGVMAWTGLGAWAEFAPHAQSGPAAGGPITEGSLIRLDDQGRPGGFCSLKHTAVKADISGFLARVTVTQRFENPSPDTIEAVYTFPLPQRAAVDDVTLTVGDRVVRAKITPREEAQTIYEAARRRGHLAGLLNQERPNVFTQAVANILPGETVTVTISYVETLRYEDGIYELMFPMVVGPRYIPGLQTRTGVGRTADTDRVPDGSLLTPPVTPPGTRAGHDLSLEVTVDAGLPLGRIESKTHDVMVERTGPAGALVRLKSAETVPNRDFILRYAVAGAQIEDAVLAHRRGKDGFLTLILQPPAHVAPADVTPKELVFVLDTSGSMRGFPLEKAKETMRLAIEGLYPDDTFNLITFSGDTHILFPNPVKATKENVRKAWAFLESRRGAGGTEMMKAIQAAFDPSAAQDHVRIVCFMTDGYVGNDMEILAEVRRHANARVFAFGIGGAVNRFLLDKMAEHGRGEVEYVGLTDDGSAAARRFHERVRNPLMTDLSVDWGGLPMADVFPKRLPDLFSAKPVIVTARFTGPGKGIVRLSGKAGGRSVQRELNVELPANREAHGVLATLWARAKVEELMGEDYNGIQRGTPKAEVRNAILHLGLEYRLLTQYTSFVAVEELSVTEGGLSRRIDVPVEMPEGVSYEGIFGNQDGGRQSAGSPAAPTGTVPRAGSGHGFFKQAPREALEDRTARPRLDPQIPVEPRTAALTRKLHKDLAAVVERLKARAGTSAPEETAFVQAGKADVQIWLSDSSKETMAQLKELGVEILIRPKTANLVVGRVPLEKLSAVAELNGVRYMAPYAAPL